MLIHSFQLIGWFQILFIACIYLFFSLCLFASWQRTPLEFDRTKQTLVWTTKSVHALVGFCRESGREVIPISQFFGVADDGNINKFNIIKAC